MKNPQSLRTPFALNSDDTLKVAAGSRLASLAVIAARKAAVMGLGAFIALAAVVSPETRSAVFSACTGVFGAGHGWTYEEPS